MKTSFSLFVASIAVHVSLCVGETAHQSQGLPNFDSRRTAGAVRATVETERQHAADALQAQMPNVQVVWDDVIGSPRYISRHGMLLTGPWLDPDSSGVSVTNLPLTRLTNAAVTIAPDDEPATSPEACPALEIIAHFLDEHAGLFGHGSEVLSGARLARDSIHEFDGMRTVVWEQYLDDIPVFEAVLYGHVTKRGELISICSQFLPSPNDAADAGMVDRRAVVSAPPVSARQAVSVAAATIGEGVIDERLTLATVLPVGAVKAQAVAAPVLKGTADVSLVWFPVDRTTLRLCWKAILVGATRGELFQVLVDAQTAEVQVRHCWTFYQAATFHVFPGRSPKPWFYNPLRRGLAAPGTGEPPVAAQTDMVVSGWITPGRTDTVGNNVDARLDRTDQNWLYADFLASRPSDAGLSFDYVWNESLAPDGGVNAFAAVVNAFYWANWMHDQLYALGFTESAGNFQQVNYTQGLEDKGGDPLCVDVQNAAGLTPPRYNSSSTHVNPADGQGLLAPKSVNYLELGIWNGPSPDRDAAMEAETILHEYTHAMVQRLVGHQVGISVDGQPNCLNEGWATFYALALLSDPTEDPSAGDYVCPFAAYTTLSWTPPPPNGTGTSLTANYYYGATLYPHSANLQKNPLTLKHIDPVQWTASPPSVPSNPALAPNRLSTGMPLWTVTLWEVRANLIAKHGYEEGNGRVLRLVTRQLELCPPNPTFLEARQALLDADKAMYGGVDATEIWQAFAKRGMGWNASVPHWLTTSGVVEGFEMPPLALVSAITLSDLRNDFDGWVGFRFQVGGQNLLVGQLGRWVVEGNTRPHIIKLVDANGNDVPEGFVLLQTAAAAPGQFAYQSSGEAGVLLNANTVYYLLSREEPGRDMWFNHPSCPITLSGATPRGAAWAPASSPTNLVHDAYERPQSYVPLDLIHYVAGQPISLVACQPTDAALRNDFSGWVGLRFSVGATSIRVTHLARWKVADGGQTHTVKLVNASGTDVAGGWASVALGAHPDNTFAYAPVAGPNVILSAFGTYYLVSQENQSADFWYNHPNCQVALPSAASGYGPAWAYNNSTIFTSVYRSPTESYGPVNFRYVIPP